MATTRHSRLAPITSRDQYIRAFGHDLKTEKLFGTRTRGLMFLQVATNKDNYVPEQPILMDNPDAFGWWTVRQVSLDGRTSRYWCNGGSASSYPVQSLERDDLQQLRSLIAALPPDSGLLPPNGKRVLVEAFIEEQKLIRLYDQSHLPTELLAVDRLIARNNN